MDADKIAEYRKLATILGETKAAEVINALCDEVERLTGKRCETFGGFLAEHFPKDVERAVMRDADPCRLGEMLAKHHGFLLAQQAKGLKECLE